MGSIVLWLVAVAACSTSTEPEDRPHVLILTIDTLRWDYLSSSGYDLPTSPFIDELLARGTTFRRAITPIPRTTQALASLLTGTYPHTHGVRTLFDRLPETIPVLAERLGDAGYRTVAVVSNHILEPRRGLDRGFDVYDFGDDARESAETTRAALDHLQPSGEDERILAWVHYIDPHVPYYPPESIVESFTPEYEGRYRYRFGDIKGGVGEGAYPSDLGKERAVFRNTLPAEVNAHIRKLYAADIRATDDAVAALMKELSFRFGENWLIVFTADHGESLGEHGYYFDHGDYVYNPSLRVPLGFVLPQSHRLSAPRVVDDWVSIVDVLPTLIELLDLGAPGERGALEGRSLVPYMEGREEVPPRPVFAECGVSFYPHVIERRVGFNVAGRFRAVIDGRWKLIWTPGLDEGNGYELYDLEADPLETSNLYRTDHPEIPELVATLRSWFRYTRDPGRVMSDEDRERLRSLGYID